jgi:hypothetical protein
LLQHHSLLLTPAAAVLLRIALSRRGSRKPDGAKIPTPMSFWHLAEPAQ